MSRVWGATMHIFLSYASEDRHRVEEVALALQAAGHTVFFDRTSLEGGDDYNTVIREQLADADLFLFAISPHSLDAGSYTLSELRMAREKWPHPRQHVLPVLLEPMELDHIPAYLRAVTLFEPQGDLAAELAAHLAKRRSRRTPMVVGVVALAVFVAVAVVYWQLDGDSPFVNQVEPSQFVSHISFPLDCDEEPSFCVERTAYALDSTNSLAPFGEEMFELERVAFGELTTDDSRAFSVEVAVTNRSADPILLDITTRFFDLADQQGRSAELIYFCCEAQDSLEPGDRRILQLIYRSLPGWWGKEISTGDIQFRIRGFLPLLRGTWSIPPLATAD